MTENEARQLLREHYKTLALEGSFEETKEILGAISTAIQAITNIQAYRAIGTVEECREAVEKQIKKRLDYEGDGYDENGNLIYDIAKCPVCGHEFEYNINDWGSDFCSDCGQRLDWGVEEE